MIQLVAWSRLGLFSGVPGWAAAGFQAFFLLAWEVKHEKPQYLKLDALVRTVSVAHDAKTRLHRVQRNSSGSSHVLH